MMQQTVKQQLTERFVNLVQQLNQQMHGHTVDEWEGLDLTIPQFRALALLQYHGPQRMGSLSTFLGTTFSSVTSIIDRLVDKGLVERLTAPEDRRVVICQITPQGQEAFERFWRIGRMRIEELAERLDDNELALVVKAMEILCKAADRS